MTSVILDNEAVQALRDASHPKHRRAMAFVAVTATRNRRQANTHQIIVPTTIRVEAGWDRTTPDSALINRLRIRDHILDASSANRASEIRASTGVSVADAHLATTMEENAPTAILTSDVSDAERTVAYMGVKVTIVRI